MTSVTALWHSLACEAQAIAADAVPCVIKITAETCSDGAMQSGSLTKAFRWTVPVATRGHRVGAQLRPLTTSAFLVGQVTIY
jgi:hypothetical protein